jgi:hypothetical protein
MRLTIFGRARLALRPPGMRGEGVLNAGRRAERQWEAEP